MSTQPDSQLKKIFINKKYIYLHIMTKKVYIFIDNENK